jgi:hypothetical protein
MRLAEGREGAPSRKSVGTNSDGRKNTKTNQGRKSRGKKQKNVKQRKKTERRNDKNLEDNRMLMMRKRSPEHRIGRKKKRQTKIDVKTNEEKILMM